jgi:hypothetical protein
MPRHDASGHLRPDVGGQAVPDFEGVRTGGKRIGPGPFERVLWLKEAVVEGDRALQVKGTQAQHDIHRDVGMLRAEYLRAAVDAGIRAAEKVGEIISSHVIPRPHENVDIALPLGGKPIKKGK